MKQKYKNMNIIGSDETGVGDYLTPLVTCATFVPKENVEKLKKLGVKDSKMMSDKQIRDLAKEIKLHVKYSLKHLSQKGYNKLNNNLNANELKMFLHIAAINQLEAKIQDIDLIIIDQFSTESSMTKYYKRLVDSSFDLKSIKTKTKLITKAEQEHVAVAAASILAREFFLQKMDEQNKKWKTKFPLGTNSKVEKFAQEFIQKHGKDKLCEVAKLSFKTTAKII